MRIFIPQDQQLVARQQQLRELELLRMRHGNMQINILNGEYFSTKPTAALTSTKAQNYSAFSFTVRNEIRVEKTLKGHMDLIFMVIAAALVGAVVGAPNGPLGSSKGIIGGVIVGFILAKLIYE